MRACPWGGRPRLESVSPFYRLARKAQSGKDCFFFCPFVPIASVPQIRVAMHRLTTRARKMTPPAVPRLCLPFRQRNPRKNQVSGQSLALRITTFIPMLTNHLRTCKIDKFGSGFDTQAAVLGQVFLKMRSCKLRMPLLMLARRAMTPAAAMPAPPLWFHLTLPLFQLRLSSRFLLLLLQRLRLLLSSRFRRFFQRSSKQVINHSAHFLGAQICSQHLEIMIGGEDICRQHHPVPIDDGLLQF
jgi:hypothetical protein